MYIKELHLINFGKFTNKRIYLKPNMNIIYGENEAGKSTLFHFIVGVFYGFYKPYIKNRRLSDLHETYTPWNGGGYMGSLLLYDDELQCDIRVLRNFAQGQESVEVTREDTGEDVTNMYDLHPVFRLPDVAGRHLGISYTSFMNTLAIKQLGHETDEYLTKELNETIINALSTHSMDVSVSKVHDKITKELDAIGSSRRKTSLFYKIEEAISQLEIEWQASKDLQEEIYNLKEQAQLLEKEKKKVKLELKEMEAAKHMEELHQLRLRKKQIGEMEETCHKLMDQIKELQLPLEYKLAHVEEGLRDFSQLNFLQDQFNTVKKEIQSLDIEIAKINEHLEKPKTIEMKSSLEEITANIYTIEEKGNELQNLKINKEALDAKLSDTSNLLNKVGNETKKWQLWHNATKIYLLVSLITIASAFLIYKKDNGVLAFFLFGITSLLVGLILFLGSKGQYKKKKRELLELDDRHEKELHNKVVTENELKSIHHFVSDIFNIYDVSDIIGLKTLKDRYLTASLRLESSQGMYESQITMIRQYEEKQEQYIDKSIHLGNQLRELQQDLDGLKDLYHFESELELIAIKEKMEKANKWKEELNHLQYRIKDIQPAYTMESLNKEIEGLEMALENPQDKKLNDSVSVNKDVVINKELSILEGKVFDKVELENLKDKINEIDKEIIGLESKYDAFLRGHRSLSQIEEEKAAQIERYEGLKLNKEVYETIKETMEDITQELQHNFAPSLNQTVSDMIAYVTDSKYSNIKINPQMLMRLQDPDTHQMVKATQLSRGTMDLFYISLREALATWMVGDKNLPMLLDESFAHFDEKRMVLALELFAKARHQTLLFTCQKRELDLLDEKNISFEVSNRVNRVML